METIFSEANITLTGESSQVFSWDSFQLVWENDQFYLLFPKSDIRIKSFYYNSTLTGSFCLPIPKHLIPAAQDTLFRNLLTQKIGSITTRGRYIEWIEKANRKGSGPLSRTSLR